MYKRQQLIYDYLIDVKDDGSFRMNMEYFNYSQGLTMTNEKFNKLFGGPPREPETNLTQKEMDIARSLQEVTEEIVLKLGNHVYKETGLKNLCLAGGVALNCVANGRLLREGPFENIWIQPAAGDAGGALGAALIGLYKYHNKPRITDEKSDSQKGSYLGPEFDENEIHSFIKSHNNDTHPVTFKNDSQIIFGPESFSTDKDHDRWKGLEVNGFGFEEINECQQSTLFKAFERSGSYVIPNQLGIDGNYHASLQPKPIVVATCNPTQGWLKNLVYTPFMEGTLKKRWHYIQSRIYDNIPLLTAQPDYLPNLLENLNRYEIEVFVEGRWDVALQTGGEFLRSLDLVKHTKPVEIDLSTIIHVSIDSNVYPHIAATVWQLIKNGTGWIIRQVGEVPAADPDNTASRAGKKMCSYLRKIDYKGAVYLYGDRSTKSRNNIDDDKRSFFQIYNEQLIKSGFRTEDKMPSSMPSVPSVADFVNAIFDGDVPGLSIEIGEHCNCLLYTSPSPRDRTRSRMPSSA